MYTAVCESSNCNLSVGEKLGHHNMCSRNETMHYSFDFAQQVFFPSNPLQPGPIYFKTPRKCAVFGVCCEPLSSQINYLFDGACDVGKGANCVVSLLHHFFFKLWVGRGAGTSSCRQLFRTKQKKLHDDVPDVESADWEA